MALSFWKYEGAGKGPGMFDVCELLGKEETLARIDRALERLGK